MARPKIRWNQAAFREIRKRQETEDMLIGVVKDVLDQLGEGYEGDVKQGPNRLRGGIRVDSWEAFRDNEENNTLLTTLANMAGELS